MDTPIEVLPPRNYCWIPTMELEPGMVLARPVLAGSGINSVIHLPVGSEITGNTIAQLVNKGVECVAVQKAPPEGEEYGVVVAKYEARLHEIFGPDPDESCRPLLDALIAYGPN